MQILDKIIREGQYKKSRMINLQHTWEDFECAVKSKKICLFGLGAGAEFFYFKYRDYSKITMVVDNDANVQGLPFGAYAVEFDYSKEILIQDPSILKKFHDDEIVVLISSLRHYDEIAQELNGYGIRNYFSILCMEACARSLENDSLVEDLEKKWFNEVDNLPVNPRKICVSSNCDGAGHAKEILRNISLIQPKLEIVWLVNDIRVNLGEGIIKRYRKNKYASYYEYMTSGIWIGDSGGSGFPVEGKRAGQVGIELKHWSSVTLKKFNLDEKSISHNLKLKKSLKTRKKNIDFIMVGSDFDERTCRSGLGIEHGYVHVGSPRSDVLFKKNRKKPFFVLYPSLEGKKLLLYAPTFRRKGEDMSEVGYLHELDFALTEMALKKRFGGEWIILLRLHPMVADSSRGIDLPGFVIDVSKYQDSEELVAASDAMITDYSSIMFEPAYINIPVFLLATDLEEYTSKERDFYIDYESLPFSIAKNNEELRRNIMSFDEEKYKADVATFFDKYGVHEDGHAAERAARFISDLIDERIEKNN